MTDYGTHTYNTTMQGELMLPTAFDDTLQWEVSVTVTCTYPGCTAQLYGPPENCYPAEGPEFEWAEFKFFVGKTVIVKSSNEHVAVALFGEIIWARLVLDAITDAKENPDEL